MTAPDFFRADDISRLGPDEIVYPTHDVFTMDIATRGIYVAVNCLVEAAERKPSSLTGRAGLMRVLAFQPDATRPPTSPFIADFRRIKPNQLYKGHITDAATSPDPERWLEENADWNYVRVAAGLFLDPDRRSHPVGDPALLDELCFLKESVDRYALGLKRAKAASSLVKAKSSASAPQVRSVTRQK